MKKIIFAFFLFVICLTNQKSNAQMLVDKNVWSLGIGTSLPYGSFAKQTFADYAGFSDPGFNLKIDYLRYDYTYSAIAFSFGYVNSWFNEKAYMNCYHTLLKRTEGVSVQTGNYQLLYATVGGALRSPIFHGFEVLGIGKFGYALGRHPDLKVSETDFGLINNINASWDGAFIPDWEIKINYYLSDHYAIYISGNLISTTFDFKDIAKFNNQFHQYIHYVNISIGLTIMK